MSIASEITRISGNVADAYTAANAKGATMPVTQNSDNLATTIATIQTGTTPTGTISITSNGTHDVTNYATADVNVPTTAPAHYVEKTLDANGKLQPGSTIMDFTGVKSIGAYALYYAYNNNTNISGVITFPDLEDINGNYAIAQFATQATGVTGVSCPKLKKILGTNACPQAFDLTKIVVADMPSLEFVGGESGYLFARTDTLTTLNLQSLAYIRGSMANLAERSKIVSMSFYSLKHMGANQTLASAFANSSLLEDIYFPAADSNSFSANNCFMNMLTRCSNVKLHFPNNLSGSSVITGLYTYPNFGGTNTTILFDLPSTAHLTGADTVEYERNPKYDTQTALAWRVKDTETVYAPVIDWTPYYTSGTTDPAVSDAIYSDAACTQSVTTITAIA